MARARRYSADIVVVSCGAANSAKLLLASATEKHPNGLSNGSDQVGRNYMFHNSQAVLALSKEENPTVFQKTLGLNDFYLGSDDFDYPLGNIQMVGKSSAPMYRGEKPLRDQAGADSDAGRHGPPRRRLLALDRGPAAAGEPRHTGRSERPHHAQLHAHERGAQEAALPQAQGDSRAHSGCTSDHLHPAPRLPQERDPGRRLRAPGRHLPLRHRPRQRRCSTPTAGRTSSTTSTSSTRASSPASARSIRRSRRWPTRCASATISSSGSARGSRAKSRRMPPEAGAGGRRRVVIVGGGFGGLAAAHKLRHADVDVTLVDRHEPPPLPAAALPGGGGRAVGERLRLADPSGARSGAANTTVLMAEVTDVDADRRQVRPRPWRPPRLRQPDRRVRRARPRTSATTSGSDVTCGLKTLRGRGRVAEIASTAPSRRPSARTIRASAPSG